MQYNKEGILRKVYSLIFVRDIVNDKILLGYKKRGFGLHKWNGLGGKVEPNESIVEGAKRLVCLKKINVFLKNELF
jgi:8-oxo-dGTP pyrophosphatase MutT (NUDIX family)